MQNVLRKDAKRIPSDRRRFLIDAIFNTDLLITFQDGQWCLPNKFYDECRSISTGGPCRDAGCYFSENRDPQLKTYFQMYNLFGLLWGLYFVSGFGQMILSFCFATWYWTYNKYDVPFFTLVNSIYKTLRFVRSPASPIRTNIFRS